MRAPAKAVLFDAGQTLLEPAVPITQVYLAEARTCGATLDTAEFQRQLRTCWQGFSGADPALEDPFHSSEEHERRRWHEFTSRVAAPFPSLRSRHEEWLERLVRHFDRPQAWHLADGVVDVLAHLRAGGCRLGVVSNWHAALRGILGALELTPRVDFVLVSSEFGRRKPHPSIFREALRQAGVAAAEARHVGDSLADDILGAHGAGIAPILLDREDRKEPLPPGAGRISSLRQLLSLLP